jgi:signal transduction histidine kinase
MKKKFLFISIVVLFIIELSFSIINLNNVTIIKQDSVKINEVLKSVESNFNNESLYSTSLDYCVIDNEGNVLYKRGNSNESINEAIINDDIILDVLVDNSVVGKILIRNNTSEIINELKIKIIIFISVISLIQLLIIIIYYIYINNNIIKPFKELNNFSVRIANGNLDIPLMMDKGHTFGAYTEAFDIMRSELKKARIKENEAINSKKEMVAKLSHDIKTPVASIKASSEFGYELTKELKSKQLFNDINFKSDELKTLVDNLFESSINDITEIKVNPLSRDSNILLKLIKNSDYLDKIENEFSVPDVKIYIDELRLQQALDNVFINSYKYANTNINVDIRLIPSYLVIDIKDYGNSVNDLEIPLLLEKYKRGSNVKKKDGAGLGLYLTNYYLTNMDGRFEIKNLKPGFECLFYIRLI